MNLPVGASVTYTVSASLDPRARGSLANTATVTVPAGMIDSNPANNTATDTDAIVLPTLSTIVHYGGDGGPAIFDTITYANGGTFSCLSQAEDGVTSCDHMYALGTVVTVTLSDDAQFLYICPGDPFMYQSTSGPFTGSCTVTMNANEQVFVVGNEQL